MKYLISVLGSCFVLLIHCVTWAQQVPSPIENINFLTTFGEKATTNYRDDDHIQIFFFIVPETHTAPFYLRIFDPETAGQHDLITNQANTTTTFSIYGGSQAFSHPDAKEINPKGNYKSGILLHQKTFLMSM